MLVAAGRYKQTMKKIDILKVALCFILQASCTGGGQRGFADGREDATAKALMQGIWLYDDDGDVAFRIEGDTIFYPDSTSLPVYFQVVADTIVLHDAQKTQYPIERQTEHYLQIRNQADETISLIKSENSEDDIAFAHRPAIVLNQQQLIRRDTVVTFRDNRFHSYVQVNPTTYKVVKSTVNEDGLAVDNVYYDNIVNLTIYQGATRVYSSDFRKADFADYIPGSHLSGCILSDIAFERIDEKGLHYEAALCIPDSPLNYIVALTISREGQKTLAQAE